MTSPGLAEKKGRAIQRALSNQTTLQVRGGKGSGMDSKNISIINRTLIDKYVSFLSNPDIIEEVVMRLYLEKGYIFIPSINFSPLIRIHADTILSQKIGKIEYDAIKLVIGFKKRDEKGYTPGIFDNAEIMIKLLTMYTDILNFPSFPPSNRDDLDAMLIDIDFLYEPLTNIIQKSSTDPYGDVFDADAPLNAELLEALRRHSESIKSKPSSSSSMFGRLASSLTSSLTKPSSFLSSILPSTPGPSSSPRPFSTSTPDLYSSPTPSIPASKPYPPMQPLTPVKPPTSVYEPAAPSMFSPLSARLPLSPFSLGTPAPLPQPLPGSMIINTPWWSGSLPPLPPAPPGPPPAPPGPPPPPPPPAPPAPPAPIPGGRRVVNNRLEIELNDKYDDEIIKLLKRYTDELEESMKLQQNRTTAKLKLYGIYKDILEERRLKEISNILLEVYNTPDKRNTVSYNEKYTDLVALVSSRPEIERSDRIRSYLEENNITIEDFFARLRSEFNKHVNKTFIVSDATAKKIMQSNDDKYARSYDERIKSKLYDDKQEKTDEYISKLFSRSNNPLLF